MPKPAKPIKSRGNHWDVDNDGKAVIVLPGIPTATTEVVTKKRLEREIQRLDSRLQRATEDRDKAQELVDELTATKAEMDDLLVEIVDDD